MYTGPALLQPGSRVVISTRAVRHGAGSSRVVLALVQGLRARGHAVDVVADRIAVAEVRRAGGTPRFPLGAAWLQRLGRRLLSRPQQLALRQRAVERLGAGLVLADGDLRRQDVVVVHNIMRREVEALGSAATAGHERDAVAQELALRGNRYRLVLANSELSRREFTARYGVPEAGVAVAYPGFDPVQFSRTARGALRDPARRELGVAAGEFLVGFISSGHFRLRGVAALATTLAQLDAPLRSRLRLLCVGSEANTGLLRAELARLGLGDAIIARPRSDAVERHYHAADLLFHPARFETFGLVVEEAAACGTPVLTSAAVGAAELFRGDGARAVVERPEADLFAPVLSRMLADAGFTAAVAGSQHDAVRGNTWAAYADNALAALRPVAVIA